MRTDTKIEKQRQTLLKTLQEKGHVITQEQFKKRKGYFCINCSSYNDHSNHSFNKYCNVTCQKEYEWSQRKKLIEDGKCNRSPLLRKYLIEKYGHICQNCRRNEWGGKSIPLKLEHIDGNSENNNLENLKMICPNCHAQTPTYKNKNRGHGRANRRKRYQEGKSY
jgi:5-methylcytosine-specific restriction endonuclease McrA